MENVIFLLKSLSKAFTAHGAQNVLGVLTTAFPLVLFACVIRGSWLPSKDSSPRITSLCPLHLPPCPFPLALVSHFGVRKRDRNWKGPPPLLHPHLPLSSWLLPCFLFLSLLPKKGLE